MTRAEHLNWCKARALDYVVHGDLDQALVSMLSDLSKHDDTAQSAKIGGSLCVALQLAGQLNTPQQVTDFIIGFN